MSKKFHYWQVACSVCNRIQYGFGDSPLDIINPDIKCDEDSCDGNCYIISQTANKDTWIAQNEALAVWSAAR